MKPAQARDMDHDAVSERLVVGACPVGPGDLERLRRERRVDGLLSVQHDECLAALGLEWRELAEAAWQLGIRPARVPIRDFDLEDMRRQLPAAVRALHSLLAAGCTVYVHCTQGVGRSPLVAAAYLCFVERLDPVAAYARVRAARPKTVPLWDALMGCRHDLLRGLEAEIARRVAESCPPGAGEGTLALVHERVEAELLRERVLAADSADI